MRKVEELWAVLKRLPHLDYSESKLGDSPQNPFIIQGVYNRIDISKSSGWVVIKGFANIVDASEAEELYLELIGRFNVVDVSRATIKLIRENAEIIVLDASSASFL